MQASGTGGAGGMSGGVSSGGTQFVNLSPDIIARYKKRFDAIDLNKDGIITLREMAAVSRVFGYRLSIEELADIFGKRDLDDSGGINFEEFVVAMVDRASKANQVAPIRRVFSQWDVRNRGYITADEAYPYCHANLGFDMNKTESFIDLFDKNRDYRLSMKEFQPFYAKYQELNSIISSAFQRFDMDNDGLVTLQEAQGEMLSKGLSLQDITSIFQKYDTDGDGKLNRTEFACFWNIPIF